MKKYCLLLILQCAPFILHADGFSLVSSAFGNNSMIPTAFTCNGADNSPPLSWSGAPDNTASFALVVNDPDAPSGQWTHWIIFNIPATATSLEPGHLPEEAQQALNSWNNPKYQGPCPSLGAHHYDFTLYALDKVLDLNTGAPTNATLDAMTGHVIGSAVLGGLYQKE